MTKRRRKKKKRRRSLMRNKLFAFFSNSMFQEHSFESPTSYEYQKLYLSTLSLGFSLDSCLFIPFFLNSIFPFLQSFCFLLFFLPVIPFIFFSHTQTLLSLCFDSVNSFVYYISQTLLHLFYFSKIHLFFFPSPCISNIDHFPFSSLSISSNGIWTMNYFLILK